MDDNNKKEQTQENFFMNRVLNKATGKLMYSAFSNARVVEVSYRLIKNNTGSSSEFLLEGIVGSGAHTRTYIMPDDNYLINALQELPDSQSKQLKYKYQIVELPDGNIGYAEESLLDGMARIFRQHPGLDQIFSDIAVFKYSQTQNTNAG